MEGCFPEWSTGTTNKYMVKGAQLCTRDGRKIGNARVIDFCSMGDLQFAVVKSDIGTEFRFTERELKELFYRPRFLVRI